MPTTSTDTLPDSPPPNTTEPEPLFGLGLVQILASTLAAVSAALAASFLGVAGTIIGAALGSLVATIGSAIYAHSLRTAGSRLQRLRPPGPGTPSARAVPGPAQRTPGAVTLARRRWLGASAAVIAGFVLALTGLTLAETVLGHPVSNNGTTGTTLARAVDPAPAPELGRPPTPEPPASTAPRPAPTTATAPAGPATTPAPTTATTTAGTTTPSAAPTPSSPPTSPPTGPSATPSAAAAAPPTSASPPAPAPKLPRPLQP